MQWHTLSHGWEVVCARSQDHWDLEDLCDPFIGRYRMGVESSEIFSLVSVFPQGRRRNRYTS